MSEHCENCITVQNGCEIRDQHIKITPDSKSHLKSLKISFSQTQIIAPGKQNGPSKKFPHLFPLHQSAWQWTTRRYPKLIVSHACFPKGPKCSPSKILGLDGSKTGAASTTEKNFQSSSRLGISHEAQLPSHVDL